MATLVPVVVPLLLLAGMFAWTMVRDAEPGGLGEPPTGLVPGAVTVTGWHRFDVTLVPAGFRRFDAGHHSPQALVDTMVADARQAADGAPWITGTLIDEEGDTARARVYLPPPESSGSTAAIEMVLELSVNAHGWYVTDADVRFHCERAVRESLCG